MRNKYLLNTIQQILFIIGDDLQFTKLILIWSKSNITSGISLFYLTHNLLIH